MFTSFSTALSALNATATAVDVVGNNLANLNTPGFKTNVVYFRDLVTQSLGAGLVAGFYNHGYTQQAVDKMIAGEISGDVMN